MTLITGQGTTLEISVRPRCVNQNFARKTVTKIFPAGGSAQ